MIIIEVGTTRIEYNGDTETVKQFLESNYTPDKIVILKDESGKVLDIMTIGKLFSKINTL